MISINKDTRLEEILRLPDGLDDCDTTIDVMQIFYALEWYKTTITNETAVTSIVHFVESCKLLGFDSSENQVTITDLHNEEFSTFG